VIRKTFEFFVIFAQGFDARIQLTESMIYLGLAAHDRTLPGALSALHVILWKFVLIAFTRVDTDSATFEPVNVWLQAVRRFRRNLQALGVVEARRQQRAINLGRQPPSTRGTDEAAKPLAHWDAEAGVFEIDKRATDLFELLDDELHTYGSSAHR